MVSNLIQNLKTAFPLRHFSFFSDQWLLSYSVYLTKPKEIVFEVKKHRLGYHFNNVTYKFNLSMLYNVMTEMGTLLHSV